MKCLINGIEYQLASGWNIGDKLGNPAPSYFTVKAEEGQEAPKSGDVITIINDNDRIIFFGLVAIPTSDKFSSPFQPRIYNLKCTNANTIAKRRIANVSYANKTLKEIVNNLFTLYIESENITEGEIGDLDLPFFEVYNCKNMNLMSVLNELAGFANGAWRITNEKEFEFISFSEFPHVDTVLNIDNVPFSDLKISDNSSDMRTVQIIDGASLTTDLQTESFVVTYGWTGFSTIFPIVQQPRIFRNGSEIPSSAIGVSGIDSGDGILFFWSYKSNQVQLNPDYSGSIPIDEGDEIEIQYIGETPIRYQVANQEKIDEIAGRTGLSGMIDNLYTDQTIVTRQDARNKADTLLSLYDERRTTITAKVSIDVLEKAGYSLNDTELYRQWTFDLPHFGIEGEFVVVERTLQPLVLDDDESVMISLTFADRDFALGYGTMFSKLYTDVTKLSVRAEANIIYDQLIDETLDLAEELETGETIPLWVADIMRNGQIAQPLGTIMPNLVNGGANWRDRWTIFVTTVDTGEVCTPYLGADQYLCSL